MPKLLPIMAGEELEEKKGVDGISGVRPKVFFLTLLLLFLDYELRWCVWAGKYNPLLNLIKL